MAAHENLSKTQFFHGSWNPDFKPGDLIHPSDAGENNTPPEGQKVHFTPNHNWAAMYGHVYEVEPTDHSKVVNWGDRENMNPKNEDQLEHQKRIMAPVSHSGAPFDEYVSTSPIRVIKKREDLSYPKGHRLDPFQDAKYSEKGFSNNRGES